MADMAQSYHRRKTLQQLHVKVCFYIALYPVRWTAQSASHFSSPGRPVHSDTNSASLGSILATHQLSTKTNHSHYISTAFHSQILIYTAEWTKASWRERKCPNFKMVAKRGLKPGLSRLRVPPSTTELSHSTLFNHCYFLL